MSQITTLIHIIGGTATLHGILMVTGIHIHTGTIGVSIMDREAV